MTVVASLISLRALLVNNLGLVYRPGFTEVTCLLVVVYAVLKVTQVASRRLKTTALHGPPNPSFVWGVGKVLLTSPDPEAEYEKWAEEYGGAYEIQWTLGGRRIILCDPKAIAHVCGGDTRTYLITPFGEAAALSVVGEGLMVSSGESHRRQRKMLNPAFSYAAITDLIPVFYDSAYKVKSVWDSLISSDSTVIEVQNWMNHISLDNIGIAGFSHDFRSLDGEPSTVTEVFDSFGTHGSKTLNASLILLAQTQPWLLKLPTPHSRIIKKLNDTMGEISNALLTKSRKEREAGTLGENEQKSVLGLLIGAESPSNRHYLTREEVIAQAKVMLLAGYETTSISLTWALIELSKNPDVQTKLRAELLEFGADATQDQLSNDLPYLDAVVHETLRMHPPVQEFLRMAAADDVIPLGKPVRNRSGQLINHLSIAKGTHVYIPIPSVNRLAALWGPDSKEFRPERWITEDGLVGARDIQGHRHLLTFIDGPRACLGKGFAIAEFKIVLSILVKHFVFELRDGPETKIEMTRGILPRPKVAGEEGTAVPLRVRRFE